MLKYDFIIIFSRGVCMPVEKSVPSATLVEIVDRILDKGLVVDAWVKVSLVGIEILSIELRAVVASVETWIKYAEAVGLTVAAPAAAPAAAATVTA